VLPIAAWGSARAERCSTAKLRSITTMPNLASNHSSCAASLARGSRSPGSAAVALAAALALSGCDPGTFPRTETCDGGPLRPVPADPSEHGPWAVGVRTVQVKGMTVEVWYPAGGFPQATTQPVTYDIRDHLPTADRDRISDAKAPIQTCDCYRDVPADLSHGPYPVVLFLPGQGSFRTQSLPQMLHWASRGFVVLAADHPGLHMADVVEGSCHGHAVEADVRGDVEAIIAALRERDHAFAFLGHRLDPTRIAIAGHSMGGIALTSFGDLAQVLIPMAAKGTEPGHRLESTLVLGGTADALMPYRNQRLGYESSPTPKRLVGIANADHFAFSVGCTLTNAAGENLGKIFAHSGICGTEKLVEALQCESSRLPAPVAWEIIDTVTSAVIEETLACDPDVAQAFETLREDHSAVAELREDL
jgi:predicted dienelactone hydrolase